MAFWRPCSENETFMQSEGSTGPDWSVTFLTTLYLENFQTYGKIEMIV